MVQILQCTSELILAVQKSLTEFGGFLITEELIKELSPSLDNGDQRPSLKKGTYQSTSNSILILVLNKEKDLNVHIVLANILRNTITK